MKNLVVRKARESKIPVQQMYGLYAMDRLVLKLSKTEYADNLIVKGGFLLTTDLGVSMRATRDLDFTIKNFCLDEDTINELIDAIEDKEDIDKIILSLEKTMNQRETFIDMNDYKQIIDDLTCSENQKVLWLRYADEAPYAEGIAFGEVMDQIYHFSNELVQYQLKKNRKKRLNKNYDLEL